VKTGINVALETGQASVGSMKLSQHCSHLINSLLRHQPADNLMPMRARSAAARNFNISREALYGIYIAAVLFLIVSLTEKFKYQSGV
jgi:hypothetical protein